MFVERWYESVFHIKLWPTDEGNDLIFWPMNLHGEPHDEIDMDLANMAHVHVSRFASRKEV